MIVGVKFGSSGKIYYFDPNNIEFALNDGVIVETVRGQEYAKIGQENTIVDDKDIKAPLKSVVRKATAEDDKRAQENLVMKDEAIKVCQRKIDKHNLKMKLVDAEYTFDRSKVIFSFTAEGRIDFRDLVKDLAGEMKMRIELRQIYERDDIKLRGAMGMCGRPCCCISHLGEYEKATVKMAKNQNLSLNPTKVSGMCGKLMCCLKYENDHYVAVAKQMPKLYASVKTKNGVGKVENVDLLKERIKVSIHKDDGIDISYYSIGEFDVPHNQRNNINDKDDDKDELSEE